MKRAMALVVLVGCNDAQPDTHDAATPNPHLPNAAVVQQVATGLVTGDSATITLAPTQAGNAVFLIAGFEAATPTWMHTVSLDSVQLSPDSGHVAVGCGRTFEFWSTRDGAVGSTTLQLSLEGPATFQAVAFEVAGLSAYPLQRSQNYFSTSAIQPTPPVIDAQTYTDAGELILGTVMTCGTLTGLDASGGFMSVPLTTGTAAALLLPSTGGLTGPHWLFDGADWYEMTISYR